MANENKPQNPLDLLSEDDLDTNLLQSFRKYQEDTSEKIFEVFLKNVKDIRKFRKDLRTLLFSLYTDPDPNVRRFATLANALLTQSNVTFTLVRTDLNMLFQLDPQQQYKDLDGKYYRVFISTCIKRGWLKQLEPSITKGNRKGAIFEVTHPKLFEYLILDKGMAHYQAEKEYALDWYHDRLKNNEDVKVDPEIEAKVKEWEAKADVRFNRK